jgi:hypothetical protein
MKLFPITASHGAKSISDDDLCCECDKCHYESGGMSSCDADWPGFENADGYVCQCEAYVD